MTPSSLLRALHVLAVITLAQTTYANAPRLVWEPSPQPNIAGYRVYHGEASRSYSHVLDVGMETSVLLTNLNAGVTHYLAVTAYDRDQIESAPSDEVSFTAAVDGVTSAIIPIRLTRLMNAAIIEFNGRIGQQCRIVASPDLNEWHEVHSLTLPINGPTVFTETGADSNALRFYRVVATPP